MAQINSERFLADLHELRQFGASGVGKGVVRSLQLQQEAVSGLRIYAKEQLGLDCLGSVPSEIKGPKGNQEYFLLLGSPC